jgi:CRISPR/Cas system-associated exonuclease Cas4 (RecB family)
MIKPPYSYSNLALYEFCAAKHNYQRILKLKPLEDTTHPAAMRGTMLHEACESFIKGEVSELPRELSQFKPVLEKLKAQGAQCEVKLACTIDMEPCAYDSPDAYFYGIIDTLELSGTTAQVGDWKSGKKNDYSSQLGFYTMLLFINYPMIKDIATRIRYIDLGVSEPGVQYNRRDEPKLWEKYTKIVQRMTSDRIRSPTPNEYCRYCPYSKGQMNICKW